MSNNAALKWAAQAWCTPTTSDIPMDPRLGKAFARILKDRVDQAIAANEIHMALGILQKHLHRQKDLRKVWIDNIACKLWGRKINTSPGPDVNALAEEILSLLLGD